MKGLHELDPAPVELDSPAQVGVGEVLNALLIEHVGELGDRHEGGPGPLADRDRVGEVILVGVRDDDMGRIHVVRGDLGGRIVRRQEGIDQYAVVAVHQLDRGMADVVDLHLGQSSFVGSDSCFSS